MGIAIKQSSKKCLPIYISDIFLKVHIDYRCAASLCNRVWKEIIKKTMREKKIKITGKSQKIFFEILMSISSYHSWYIVVNNLDRS